MAKQTHTLFLSKPDVDNFELLLSEKARDRIGREGTQIIDIADFADGARLYVFAGDFFTPTWVLELRKHFPFGGNIVRRQNIWHSSRRKLAECGPRPGVDIKRRACGAASAGVRWSSV